MQASNATEIPIHSIMESKTGYMRQCSSCSDPIEFHLVKTVPLRSWVLLKCPDTGEEKAVCSNCHKHTKLYDGWEVVKRVTAVKI